MDQQKDKIKTKKQPKWEREEVVLLVVEYFRTRDLSRTERIKSIGFISNLLRARATTLGMDIDETYRNEKGIEMKFGNIQSMDKKAVEEGKVGLTSASKLDVQVVREYYEDADMVVSEAYRVVMRYLDCIIN